MKSNKSVISRRQDIVAWVNQHGHTQVETLAVQFNTSAVTIRKDLAALAEDGLIIRQFGGALPIASNTNSVPELTDVSFQSGVKSALGKCAASLITTQSKVVIDCGSTTSSVLPFITGTNGLIVMTNALATANFLTQCESEPTVLMTGGTWDAQSQSFQGAMAEHLVSAYSFDIALIGAAGIDVSRGTTTFNELTGVTRAMARAADKVVVMAGASKLTNKMPNLELGWSEISTLITDESMSEQDKKRIKNQGVDVIIATPVGE